MKYLYAHDKTGVFKNYIFKKPLKYGFRLLTSYLRKKTYLRKDDFFLYGIKNLEEFKERAKNSLLVLGFSYCHKPFECPSGRFTDQCIRQKDHPVCSQCFINDAAHAATEKAKIFMIPTIHYIGEKMMELVAKNPHQPIIFLITACELTLEMFGDFGHMAGLQGIGVRLDGRICNTFKAFELSEVGIKPGMTVVRDETKEEFLDLIRAASETVLAFPSS